MNTRPESSPSPLWLESLIIVLSLDAIHRILVLRVHLGHYPALRGPVSIHLISD